MWSDLGDLVKYPYSESVQIIKVLQGVLQKTQKIIPIFFVILNGRISKSSYVES